MQRNNTPQKEVNEEHKSFDFLKAPSFGINHSPSQDIVNDFEPNTRNANLRVNRKDLNERFSTETTDRIIQSIVFLKTKLRVMWLIAFVILFICIYQI